MNRRYWGLVFRKLTLFLTLMVAGVSPTWSQGFLEMPEVEEVPDYERDSMLLDLDVPPVRDRDPDPRAGPRLNVKEFRLQGIVEFPELGITTEALRKQIEAIRFDMMDEGERLFSGFSLDELGEMSDLVVDIEKSVPIQHVGDLEVQQFVFLIRDLMRRRGATLGMIETVADTITQYYRERGFILAKAFIPKQKVRDGVVTLTLLLGELGAVEVVDNKRVSTKLVQRVFRRDMYKPVTNKKIDEGLYLVNDIPGVRAQGFFSPGKQVGDTNLTVKVLEEDRYTLNFRLDNHGSESTSKNRAYTDIYLHNPFGIGDELQIGLLKSYNPDRNTYGALRYNLLLAGPRLRSSFGISSNDFVSRIIGVSGSTVLTGESLVADAGITYSFKRSRVKNFSTELKFMNIDTELVTQSSPSEENVKKASLAFHFDILNERARQLYYGNVIAHSARVSEEDTFTGESSRSESFLSSDLSMLSFFTLPFSKYETRFLIKNSFQFAGKSISNLNQITLTGPTRTRAFGVNGFQADDGIYLGADWIFPLPKMNNAKLFGQSVHRLVQPYIYADASYGVKHKFTEFDEKIIGRLSNFGAGVRFNYSSFSANFMFSKVVKDDVGNLDEETPRSAVYFDMQYTY